MQRPSFSIYDASAGSGKTYALVKEYLKIILVAKKNDAYRNILAITFTNKAVHEMKSRIVGSLSEFAKDEPSSKAVDLMQDLAVDTALSVIQIKTKSQQIIKHIIHNYAAFDISTIDKFTHKVIRAFAHDLGLPMTFEVTLDTENLLVEAVDAIIAQAGEDETLTKLLIDFTMEKTDDDKSWDISREILDTGRLVLNENNRNEITHFQDKSIADFVAIKAKLNEACKVLEIESVAFAEEALLLIEKNGIDSKSFSAGHFPKHLISIQEGKFNPKNKTYHEFDAIKINKTAKDRAIIENIIPELLQLVDTIYKAFEKRDFYKAFLKNITPLSLLNTVSNELAKIQSEQNVLSISEFNAIIHREIQNQPAPFIYERLGERYRHFFIDEFQDTSEMQWQNLIPLIDNATSSEIDGEKGTLMIVGDPKQSIYRWRGGKAEQFIDLSKDQNPFNNPEKVLKHLDKNYRSYSQVIEFNNDFFKMLSNEFEHLDYKDLYANHSHQKLNDKKGGYVNISFIPKVEKTDVNPESLGEEEALDKTELYVLATLNTIQKVIREGFEYKDIVILTRKRSQGIAIATYLTEQQIPLLSSETLMIQNATEVRLIIHLLKYLKNSSDLESKANFLQYLAQNSQDKLPVHDFIAKGMSLFQETDFENWLMSFDVSLSFQNIRKKSLYEAVETIVAKFLSLALSKEKGDEAVNGVDKLGYMTGGNYSHLLIEKAKEKRKEPTHAEKVLWMELKSKSLEDYKFSQQHLIDDFIVDFVCLSKKLIVEVDGDYHFSDEQIDLDENRTRTLKILGYKVIRFTNEQVIKSISEVLKEIKKELVSQEVFQDSISPVMAPFPSGRAGVGNAYVQYFLDIVLESDIRNQAGISDFLNFWDKNAEKFSIPSPEGTNAVRIMTIHKSKGLEFPVVIFPFAEEDYNRKPKDKLWLNAEEQDFGLPKVLIDNSVAVEGFGEEAAGVYNQKKEEELLDNINVLYVALTRAEEQLYVISNMNLSRKEEVPTNNMCTFFINYLESKNVFKADQIEYEFGKETKLSTNKKHVDTSKRIPLVAEILKPKNIKIAQREALMWGTHQQEAIEYGNIIHEILSFVKTKNDVDLAITKSIEDGLITFAQKEIVFNTIQEIVNHRELEICFAEGNEVWNEQTIIQKQGKTIKPDRMVLTKNNEVFLLDYKTGTHNSKYQLQLENYQSAIELMGYKVVKKALIYIGKEIDVVNL
ncbi:ATP-dependent exoDNAse (exonuclease V) beta subunit/very-short-patch-repair endonuclease [Flavobacterium sp. CG_9.1]|uniref:UvrD-helicase domain-containing protein n=1 Tax=Flavobacterium sp. CG_9.1 TaxID=2787728 RepID=UPI0018CADEAF|nr:UvrD-helicase domain-containing protein [Flavobacterium sp. CG_9.1]MBG6060924.1 ATP-dependent exoDNAse (exonuclease V) beta subunit/very-short-patch-repair endonuclease [Flavobacterium sp. CG_9.1]